jgi:hypothetical protein
MTAASVRALRLVAWLAFLPFAFGPWLALFDHRLGAFVFLGGVLAQIAVHRLFALVAAGMRPQSAAGFALAMIGIVLALVGSDVAAAILIAGLAIQIVTDTAVGVRGYRATMNRQWPQVAPLADDDDW